METPSGAVGVIDFMPGRDAAPDIVRMVEGVRAACRCGWSSMIRFDYGTVVPWVRRTD